MAIEVDRAGTALGDPAAELGAGQTDEVPEHPKKRHVGWRLDLTHHTVDLHIDRHHRSPAFRAMKGIVHHEARTVLYTGGSKI